MTLTQKELSTRHYRKRKENGMRPRCGKRKAAPGKKKCSVCLEKDVEQHRKKIYVQAKCKGI